MFLGVDAIDLILLRCFDGQESNKISLEYTSGQRHVQSVNLNKDDIDFLVINDNEIRNVRGILIFHEQGLIEIHHLDPVNNLSILLYFELRGIYQIEIAQKIQSSSGGHSAEEDD